LSTAAAAGVGALMEKPLDATQLLQTIEQLLAESKEDRLRRLCGHKRDTRHVASSRRFLQELRAQHSEPATCRLTFGLQT
jgi:DNA-binding NtrC family response regulator